MVPARTNVNNVVGREDNKMKPKRNNHTYFILRLRLSALSLSLSLSLSSFSCRRGPAYFTGCCCKHCSGSTARSRLHLDSRMR